MKKFAFFALLLTIILSLQSCLNIQRNIKINADGSGTETLDMKLGSEFIGIMNSFAEMIDSSKRQAFLDSINSDENFILKTRAKFDKKEGVKLIDIRSVTNPDSSKDITVIYEFDNVSSISAPVNADDGINAKENTKVTFEDLGDRVKFTYIIQPSSAEKIADSSSNSKLAEALLANDKLTINVEFPFDVVSSNAAFTSGRTLTWEYGMNFITRQTEPLILTAELRK